MTDENETVDEEIVSVLEPSDEERELWVYHPQDDFKITIPAGARVTFGYFNPAAAGTGPSQQPRYGYQDGTGAQTMKTTCLRVYADAGNKNQIGAFLGVSGFRDTDLIKKTLMKRKITVEINHEDDGYGNIDNARKQLAAGNFVDEDALF